MIVYGNGKIHTMDEALRVASALAVEDGVVQAVGETEELRRQYPQAEFVDLQGACVIPGLIDTHEHLFMAADSEADREMVIPASVEELLQDVRRRAAEQEPGTWIAYPNTYPLRLRELRYPTRQELDAAAPDHLVSVDGFYSCQLNSRALAALDLRELPPGGRALTDDTGEPTGTLLNCNALVSPHYPKRTRTPLKAALRRAMEAYARVGITSAAEGMSNPEGMRAVAELQAQGAQTLRLRYTQMLPRGADLDAFIRERREVACGDPALARLGFCKKTIDGGILTGTSLMENGYREQEQVFSLTGLGESWRGNLVTDVDELADAIEHTQRAGLQFGAHCVGSGASEKLLQAYERVDQSLPVAGKRHVLIHADFMNPDQLARAKRLGLCLLFQPAWHYLDAPYVERVTCKAEMDRFLPYRDILASGVFAGAGSDHMVKLDPKASCNPFHPFLGLYNMVTCRARDGKAYNAGQRIGRDEALLFYTRKAAWTLFDENLTGALAPGLRADFAVLDRDYFTCPEEEIAEINPVMTVLDGKAVYRA